jgi:hypothetical protein
MKKLIIEPAGWPCKLRECPPGLFVTDMDTLCIKTDYPKQIRGPQGLPGPYVTDAYCSNGDSFSGIADDKLREELIVQPVKAVWVETEE